LFFGDRNVEGFKGTVGVAGDHPGAVSDHSYDQPLLLEANPREKD
jgi:hypothetical protein